MSDETFEINPCPLCGKSHKYLLTIHRSEYLFGRKNPSSGKIRRIKRLVSCPEKNEFFETILELNEDERGTIATVQVDGVVEDGENGTEK